MQKAIRGLLLIAHGSRNPEANHDLVLLARQLQGEEFPVVVPSYLELSEPSIREGANICVAKGATDITMVPYFLSAGVHVCKDLQDALEQMRDLHPQATFRLAPPLGRHPLLMQILRDRISEAR